MFCMNCGNYNPEEAQNCSSCGASLTRNDQQNTEQYSGPASGQGVVPIQPMSNYQPYVPQQPYGEGNYFPNPVFEQPISGKNIGKGAGIASLVLGIVSLALFCFPVVALLCSIVGLIFGIISVVKSGKAGKKCGVGIAGLICSGIGLIFGAVYNVAIFASVIENISEGYYYY